jgi:hypothetical protein
MRFCKSVYVLRSSSCEAVLPNDLLLKAPTSLIKLFGKLKTKIIASFSGEVEPYQTEPKYNKKN